MLVDDVSRWSVLTFASVHVLGLLTHHPVPWSATAAAVSLLVVASAGTVRAATGTLRSLALLAGLAAAAGLVAMAEWRGGGAGWPFFLTEAPAGGWAAWVEAVLLTVAVLGLSAAALLPERGAEERLRGFVARLRASYTGRRNRVLDLLEPPPAPDPATGGGPVVLDLGVLAPHAPAAGAAPRTEDRPRRGAAWWRRRIAVAGVGAFTTLVALVAAGPLWQPDRFGQTPVAASRDHIGMLLATAPILLAVIAVTVAGCLHLRRARGRGVALAAVAFVALAVPVAWGRGGDDRFSPEPPAPVAGAYGWDQGIDELHAFLDVDVYRQLTEDVDVDELVALESRSTLSSTVDVDPGFQWPDPGAGTRVHPADAWPVEPDALAAPGGWTDGSWWSEPFDWDEAGDGVVAGLAVAAFLALVTALLPLPHRPELLD